MRPSVLVKPLARYSAPGGVGVPDFPAVFVVRQIKVADSGLSGVAPDFDGVPVDNRGVWRRCFAEILWLKGWMLRLP